MKNIRFFFLSESFSFLIVKFSIYLKRLVFVMRSYDLVIQYVFFLTCEHVSVTSLPLKQKQKHAIRYLMTLQTTVQKYLCLLAWHTLSMFHKAIGE